MIDSSNRHLLGRVSKIIMANYDIELSRDEQRNSELCKYVLKMTDRQGNEFREFTYSNRQPHFALEEMCTSFVTSNHRKLPPSVAMAVAVL